MLIISSNLVGCSTGRSEGLALRRRRPHGETDRLRHLPGVKLFKSREEERCRRSASHCPSPAYMRACGCLLIHASWSQRAAASFLSGWQCAKAVLRTATFFGIPVVRAHGRDQTRNARGEDETCPGTRQI